MFAFAVTDKMKKKCNNFQEFKVGSHRFECADFRIHVKAPGFQPDQPSWSDWFRTNDVKKRENLFHFWFFKAEKYRFQRSEIANCIHSDSFSCELMIFFLLTSFQTFPHTIDRCNRLVSCGNNFRIFLAPESRCSILQIKLLPSDFGDTISTLKHDCFLLSTTFWSKIKYSCYNFLA